MEAELLLQVEAELLLQVEAELLLQEEAELRQPILVAEASSSASRAGSALSPPKTCFTW